MSAIDVVHCCPKDFCNIDFSLFSRQSTYEINILSSGSFLNAKQSNSSQLIVVIDESYLFNPSKLTTLKANIIEKKYHSRICLWKNTGARIPDPAFTYLFDDFIFLPCCENELTLRLNRNLFENKNLNTSACENEKLFMEFSPLKLHGESTIFIRVLNLIKQISRFVAPVLIEGETGTGKENAARAIHYLGRRQNHAFIPINCGAIPDNLIESELFGFEKGAFTDAKNKSEGLLSLADKGTLFLDEVDSLSPKAQATLLRFLQSGEYRSLGGKRLYKSDVRIIAATNATLENKVKNKEFREDLYFRLNVFKLNMPPLRHRKQDILFLAQVLLKKFCNEYQLDPKSFHPRTLEWLQNEPWPGNVRQLENTLLRELLLNSENQVLNFGYKTQDELSTEISNCPWGQNKQDDESDITCFQSAKNQAITSFEKEYINNLLSKTSGNISEAARLSGKERRAFGKLVKKYDIDKNKFITESAST